MKRKNRPRIAQLNEVDISRDGEDAIIEYKSGDIQTVHLHIGPHISDMTEAEILDVHNTVLRAQQEMAAEYVHVPVEIPEGRPQIRYSEESDQWVPRGDVLRCEISDGGPDCETTIIIDDQELSMEEFGQLLITYNGWGMRIMFVPDDRLCDNPPIEIREPDDGQ